ncbi:MAG: glycosyltransferase family 39 protein [Parcubacteria group bacterium]
MQNKKFWIWFIVFMIVALGFILRFDNIDIAPPGVYPDEAVNGEDALRAISPGDFQWFYPANQGREGLFINIQALSLMLFGVNVLALKLPSILFGTLTIFGVFLLARELFDTRVGLFSAFLVSVGYWAINFSRIGFRAIMLPFVLVFAFYFLWKGLRTKKWTDFALGGFIFGLGLHTYIAFRIAPAILVVALISFLISRPNFIREYWKKILVFILFAAIAAAPMLYTFFIAHPEYMESRSSSISIMSPEVNKGHLLETFSRSFGLSLAKYNFWGDQNWRHNYPPYPLLDFLTGIAFLFGFIYAFIRFFRLIYLRIFQKIRDPRLDIYVFLLAWFFIMLAPEFLTAEGNPHALRSIGTLPVVFIFSALAFDYILKMSSDRSAFYRKIVVVFVAAAFVFIGIFNPVKYFYFWTNKPETASAFQKNLMEAAAYLKLLPATEEKFVIAENMQRIPIKVFTTRLANISFYYPGEINRINPKKNFAIIMIDRNNEVIASLQKRFPKLELQEFKDNAGLSFYVLK